MDKYTADICEESDTSSNDGSYDGGDFESEKAKCLFCDSTFNDVEATLLHCKETHDVDFHKLMNRFQMDCYSFIKMINFIRKEVISCEVLKTLDSPVWEDDKYFKPVEEFDPWLMFDFEEHFSALSRDDILPVVNNHGDSSCEKNQLVLNLQKELQDKTEQLSQLSEQLIQMKKFVHKILQDDDAMDTHPANCVGNSTNDNGYFESYSHHGIHYDMLSDNVRTLSYKNAILDNKAVFTDKIVLDLGCGTGILSMFAASAGSKKVYAVDNSDIAFYTVDIIRENKLTEKVEVVKSKIESNKLPFDHVDIIISEWMGYFLLFEGMLDSLIYARDNLLKPGGLLLPDKCNLYICGAHDLEGYKNHIEFWNDVHGYQMSSIRNEVLKEVIIDVMPSKNIVTSSSNIASFDLYKCSVKDTSFSSSFNLTCNEDTSITAFVGYFDVLFQLENTVQFSTDSFSTPTHWKQTIFYISHPIVLKKGDNLNGRLICRRNVKNTRSLLITIEANDRTYNFDLQ
ncbi:uncharacterized protein Art3 [Planococcus citri]|uniref:uncharacterized protein Art3 n=1 Tax=Planococcus citri TaxID=170843 RepID=UPI0031F91286